MISLIKKNQTNLLFLDNLASHSEIALDKPNAQLL